MPGKHVRLESLLAFPRTHITLLLPHVQEDKDRYKGQSDPSKSKGANPYGYVPNQSWLQFYACVFI